LGDEAATGEVLVHADDAPDPGASPHARLAAARAWHAVGERALASGAAEHAVEAAESGLDELGGEYAPEDVKDDTSLKLAAARGRLAEGAIRDAAEVMLRMLRTRTELYARRHSSLLR